MSCWKRKPKRTHKVADALRMSTINIGTLNEQVSETKVAPKIAPAEVVPPEGEKLESVVDWAGVVRRYRLLHGIPLISEDDDGEPSQGTQQQTAPARIGSSFYVKAT